MITHLYGRLETKELNRAVLDVAGVGYELWIPMSSYDRLPREGENVRMLTVLHVREDAMLLYGFCTPEERTLFQLLVGTVSGVGPKLAINVLSGMPVSSFCTAVANHDIKALSQISGIGKRSAERLVMELKDKILDLAPEAQFGQSGEKPDQALAQAAEDAVAGLVALGYKAELARKAVSRLLEEQDKDQPVDAKQLLRRALAGIK